ncbi:MAG: sensor histidine kinase [Phenylobacterium sp.]
MGDEVTQEPLTPDEAAARAASEMRHRYANTFQLLAALGRMRAQKAADPELRRQLGWLADAVGSLGALERHRRPEGVDFAAYLAEMAPVWRRRQGVEAAEVALEADTFLLSDNAAAAVAVIAQELVANALAHGFADRSGRVVIRLAAEGERCCLTVSDDGCGFDENAEDGFGLWLIRSLASQARGELEIASSAGGTVGRLVFAV